MHCQRQHLASRRPEHGGLALGQLQQLPALDRRAAELQAQGQTAFTGQGGHAQLWCDQHTAQAQAGGLLAGITADVIRLRPPVFIEQRTVDHLRVVRQLAQPLTGQHRQRGQGLRFDHRIGGGQPAAQAQPRGNGHGQRPQRKHPTDHRAHSGRLTAHAHLPWRLPVPGPGTQPVRKTHPGRCRSHRAGPGNAGPGSPGCR